MKNRPLVYVPAAASTLAGFRAWAASDQFPDQGRVTYIDNGVLIDMSPEALESHNILKGEVSRVIGNVNAERDLGRQYFDRALFSNLDASISTEPDGMFLLWETLESGRAAQTRLSARSDDYIEVTGTPDWVLEIVSPSSVEKDTRLLRQAYYQAGIPEYWLINALGDEIDFQLLQHRSQGYELAPAQDGWQRSAVFGLAFKLERRRHRLGLWKYTLHFQERVA